MKLVIKSDNVLIIAGTTIDYINGNRRIGGSAYYMGAALAHFNVKPKIITNSCILMNHLKGVAEVICPNNGDEIVFELTLLEDGTRKLKLKHPARIPVSELLPHYLTKESVVTVLSPVNSELSMDVIDSLIMRSSLSVIDVQGFVRKVDDHGWVTNDLELFHELASRVRGLNVVIRGEVSEFPEECRAEGLAACAKEYKVILVQTSGPGPIYYSRPSGDFCVMRPLNGVEGVAVGSGDVFTAVLAYSLLDKGLDDAVATASVAATLKTLRDKPPWFNGLELMILKQKVLSTKSCDGVVDASESKHSSANI